VTDIATQLLQPGALRVEFQPIVRIVADDVQVYAVEALCRGPRGTSMARADVLFDYARRKGVECAIDLACIAEIFAAYAHLPAHPLLSINIHAATLAGVDHFADGFLAAAENVGAAPDRLMLEVVEHRGPAAVDTLCSTLQNLRAAGVHIAVDDIGAGASNFRMVVDCHPDHMKIDRDIVRGCSSDRWRRAVLASIASLACECNATPVAEGVENEADLQTVIDAGIDIVQGWLYARSSPAPELARSPLFMKALSKK
jgi:EAL domain-containing protein (putative c-di-GMP-specific phosphodiesterase class I)